MIGFCFIGDQRGRGRGGWVEKHVLSIFAVSAHFVISTGQKVVNTFFNKHFEAAGYFRSSLSTLLRALLVHISSE